MVEEVRAPLRPRARPKTTPPTRNPILSIPQIPVPELVSQLGTIEERELALKLCYMIIQVGQSESGKSQIVHRKN